METKINAQQVRDREAVISLTQQLVRIPSVYRPGVEGGNEEKAAHFVADYLKEKGIEVFIEEVEPGRPNVIGIIDSGKPGKTLLLEGHTDVVTEGDHSAWQYGPFDAEIFDGVMYGRGTNDTKGNLACMITAVDSILQDNETFKGKIILCIPCDEEGMMIGIKHFIKNGWAEGVDGAIICEPEENQVCISQRGAMRLELTTYGKMAHGAISWSGINPNLRMAKVIVELEKLEMKEQERLGKHPTLGWPSLTPTILRAPVKGDAQINVIPDQCMTTLDIRTVPGQDHEELKQEIRDIFTELAKDDEDFKADFNVIEDRPWTETDREEAIVKSVAKAVKHVTQKDPVYNGVPGATDGTFLHIAGVPIVTIGAGDRDIPHQINEYVEVDELAVTTQIYRQACLHFLNEEDDT
ncbi:succinyl-diaminopimelate desuccinylase [Halobacillus andaensis]|uniref:Probable succinyl-diaminopimelate desuccinylase n=1 Tax=Halobacillus andaensis TaxID=1176239 RepID=A0A917B8F3_HALAA|nr:M20 family metallopeptidase [Halobacillus andaensis]MBP2005205.1 succinyl-diaminopimelate desuccinylase [Halobacillus andaensis]GGF29657.1 succinyl-diaminopimelate desuccinylase [Halobacillus andaensis]